jgi:hypothetical protein
LLAQNYGCHVTTVDLSVDYSETAEWLNGAISEEERGSKQAHRYKLLQGPGQRPLEAPFWGPEVALLHALWRISWRSSAVNLGRF